MVLTGLFSRLMDENFTMPSHRFVLVLIVHCYLSTCVLLLWCADTNVCTTKTLTYIVAGIRQREFKTGEAVGCLDAVMIASRM